MNTINARLEKALTQVRATSTRAEKANTVDENNGPVENSPEDPAARDIDTVSIADSAIDLRSNPSHSRSASLASKPSINLRVPLLREKSIPALMEASSGRSIQLEHKRYAAIKTANVSHGLSQAQDQNIRSLVKSLSTAEAAAKGLTSLETATAALALAKAYRDAGLFENALEHYHEALAAREAALGPNHPTSLNTLDNIAQVHEIRSQWSEALTCYQTSLDGRLESPALGAKHPSTITAATKVARMHQHLTQYEEAAKKYASVLSSYTSQNKGQSLPALSVRFQVAAIHAAQGKLVDAVTEYNAVWELAEQTKGGKRLAEEADIAIKEIQQKKPPPLEPIDDFKNESDSEDDESTVLGPKDDKMIRTCRIQLEELSAALGKTHPDTLAKMYELAMAYASNGQHQNAIGWFQEVITGRTKVFGPDHPSTLDAIHQMASSHEEMANLDQALEHYHAALVGRETKLGDDHPQTLSSVVAIASVYSARADNNVARDLLLRAVDGYDRRYGGDHNATLSAKYKLAEVYREKGLLQRALELHQEVLDRRIAILGAGHPVTLNSERALGAVYRHLKRTEMAIQHLRRALEGKEKAFTRVHSVTTHTALELASVYWDSDRPSEAVVYYKQALEGIQHQDPESRTAGLVTMSNIALCYYSLKDYTQALTWYRKILAIQEEEYGKDHEETIYTAEQVAKCSMEIQEWVNAIELFQRVIVFKQKASPADVEGWSWNLYQLALAYFNKAMYEQSLSWSRKIIALEDKISPDERLTTMRRMAVIYSRQAKYDESLELYQKTMDECKITLGDDHWLVNNILDEMGELYLQIGYRTGIAREYHNTLGMLQKRLDKDNFKSLYLLYRFADVHLDQHQYREALNLYKAVLEAIESSSRAREENFKDLRNSTLSDIATCHMKLFNNDEALTYLSKLLYCGDDSYRLGALVRIGNTQERQAHFLDAIETYKQLLEFEIAKTSAQHRDPLMSVRKIAALYSRASQYQEALSWTNRALAGFRALGAEGQVETLETLDFQAGVFCNLGRFNDAVKVQREAMEGFERTLGDQHASTLKATLDLAEMLRGLERRDEALGLYTRALRGYEERVKQVRPGEGGEDSRVLNELRGKIREVGGRK